MDVILQKLFDDTTEGRIINNRLFNGIIPIIMRTTLNAEEKDKVFRLLTLICKKLIGLSSHAASYRKHEFSECSRVSENFGTGFDEPINLSDDLFLEFDGFLVQLKSTLDYLAHTPKSIVGSQYWKIRSFGEKGEVISKLLENLPKNLQHRAKGFGSHLIKRNEVWLIEAIDARNKINHFFNGGIDFRIFCVTRDEFGQIHVPMWSHDQTISQFMEVIWKNIFHLCEDFFALFLSLKLPEEFNIYRDNSAFTELVCPWKLVSKDTFEKLIQKDGVTPYPVS